MDNVALGCPLISQWKSGATAFLIRLHASYPSVEPRGRGSPSTRADLKPASPSLNIMPQTQQTLRTLAETESREKPQPQRTEFFNCQETFYCNFVVTSEQGPGKPSQVHSLHRQHCSDACQRLVRLHASLDALQGHLKSRSCLDSLAPTMCRPGFCFPCGVTGLLK